MDHTCSTSGDLLNLTQSSGTTNNNGNLLGRTIYDGASAFNQAFTYDALNRLKSATETAAGRRPTCTIGSATAP